MLDLYQALKSFPPFSRQLMCKGMLFTNYDCPQVERKMTVYIEQPFIVHVIKGRRIYHQNGHCWEFKEGTCAYVRPGGYITERRDDEEWCVMVFFIPDAYLFQLYKDNRQFLPALGNERLAHPEPVTLLKVNDLSASCFASMLPYFSQQPSPPEPLVELKFNELLLSLMADGGNSEFLHFVNGLSRRTVLTVRQVMLGNYSTNLTIDEYASLCCMSVSSFKREFRKEFNDAPARWLMKKRVEKAKVLLNKTLLPVSEVALECGFENPTHFSRVFREKTGSAPVQFRNAKRREVTAPI